MTGAEAAFQEQVLAGWLARAPAEFALSVLWSVEPTDRALAGWPRVPRAIPSSLIRDMVLEHAGEDE